MSAEETAFSITRWSWRMIVRTGKKIDPEAYSPHTFGDGSPRFLNGLPPRTCVQLGTMLSGALGYLHEQGLTHRDNKTF